jgi:hypothetical protein
MVTLKEGADKGSPSFKMVVETEMSKLAASKTKSGTDKTSFKQK